MLFLNFSVHFLLGNGKRMFLFAEGYWLYDYRHVRVNRYAEHKTVVQAARAAVSPVNSRSLAGRSLYVLLVLMRIRSIRTHFNNLEFLKIQSILSDLNIIIADRAGAAVKGFVPCIPTLTLRIFQSVYNNIRIRFAGSPYIKVIIIPFIAFISTGNQRWSPPCTLLLHYPAGKVKGADSVSAADLHKRPCIRPLFRIPGNCSSHKRRRKDTRQRTFGMICWIIG